MPIVVPDINVLVSALINRSSPPGRIIATWRRREIVFVTSQTIIDKVDEVLHRPIFASYGITDAQIARLRHTPQTTRHPKAGVFYFQIPSFPL